MHAGAIVPTRTRGARRARRPMRHWPPFRGVSGRGVIANWRRRLEFPAQRIPLDDLHRRWRRIDRLAWYRKPVPATYALLILLVLVGAFIYKLCRRHLRVRPAATAQMPTYPIHRPHVRRLRPAPSGSGLETQAEHAAASAEVLLIGNSRLQFAFSGDATRAGSPRLAFATTCWVQPQ
jgi:hypothetical protein